VRYIRARRPSTALHFIFVYRFFFTGSSSFFPDIPAITAMTAMTIPATIAFFFLSSPELELVVFFAGVAGFGAAAIGADAGAGGADAVDFFEAFFEAFFSFLDIDGATAGVVVVVVGSVVGPVVGFVVVVGALIVIEFDCEFQFPNVTHSIPASFSPTGWVPFGKSGGIHTTHSYVHTV
jgi:hypothetical protein